MIKLTNSFCDLFPVTEDPLKDIIVVDEQLVSAFKPTCSNTFSMKIYLKLNRIIQTIL